MSLPDPVTRKEMYLSKAAGGSGSVPPEPVTREEMYLAEIAKGGGSGGASSLADLSDVEINETEYGHLLRYNSGNGKWESVSKIEAIFGGNPYQGAVCVNGSNEIISSEPIILKASSQQAYLFGNIVDAAIANGQHQMNNIPKDSLIDLINAAIASMFSNVPLYIIVGDTSSIAFSFHLESATTDYATFAGTFISNQKLYRVTMVAYCQITAQSGSVLAKAEELMTFTEPT